MTVQVVVGVGQAGSDHADNLEPAPAVAVRLTDVLMSCVDVQVGLQVTPPEVSVPVPLPAFVTVRVKVLTKVAVTVFA